MKLLHIINSLQVGGAEKLLVDLIPLLKELGHTVDILLLNGVDSCFKRQLELSGIKINYLGINNNIYNPFLIFKLVKYIKKYDIVHVHLFPSQYWVAIAKLFSFSKVKLITTEHSTSNRRRNIPFFKYLDIIIYRCYSKIICISDKTKDTLAEYIGKENNLEVIYNGIDVDKYKRETRTQSREELCNIPNYCFLIEQIAGFRIQKDQDTLIRSLILLPDNIHIAFIGDGERKCICEKLVDSLKLSSRVHFLGIRDDVPDLLKVADLVVMSSHWEGFGLAAVEGMAAKKAVIASNVEGLAEVVQGAGLLFKKGDNIELSSLIMNLYKDEMERNRIASACLDRSKEYDISIMLKNYERVYKEIVNG
ncbi:MAG: glycosyltransferase [Bacteroidaceae bacterium]